MLRERSHQGGPKARSAYAKRRMRDQTEARASCPSASERRRLNGGAAAGEGRRLSDRHREGPRPRARTRCRPARRAGTYGSSGGILRRA